MRISDYVEMYEKQRNEGINLIASENVLSPAVKRALSSDLGGRYHTKWYGGSGIAVEIIERTEELARRLFRTEYAIVNPLSGNTCDLAVLFSFTSPGDKVAILPFSAGGYPLGLGKFDRERVDIPTDGNTLKIDVEQAKAVLEEHGPALVILGSSFIPFPHPVEELSAAVRGYGGHCVYDGAHILGLTAGGFFQNPLGEGAEVLFGSTHKTFYGPQGGILLTNDAEHEKTLRAYFEIDLDTGIGLVDNPHMNRIAALGIALEEMLEDPDYGRRIVENAKALAGTLNELGVPVRFRDTGFTESHQVLLDIGPDRAVELCRELEAVGIFIDTAGRFGVAEATHRGYTVTEMREIAELVRDVYVDGASDLVRTRVREFAGR
jgi:glycine hydroxymethyltransferase